MGNVEGMIGRKTIATTPGERGVYDPELVYARIHWISRSDLHYVVVPGGRITPGDLEVVYDESVGSLVFATEFNVGEKINVVYEIP